MIAVTGANGLLGSYIIRALVAHNRPFIALKRKHSDISLLNDIQSKINWVDADILDPIALEESLAGVSTVIHAAAMVSFNPRREKKLFEVNVTGTRNVVNACLAVGAKKLVHISSIAALGRLKGQTQIDENSKWIDNALNSSYAQSKYLAELEVYRGQEEGLNIVIINPSVILAAADWTKSSAKLFKYVWDENKFYAERDLNFVDVRDVADAAVRFIDTNAPGERFILNAGSMSLHEFFTKVATRFKKRSPTIKVGQSTLNLIASFENIRTFFTKKEPLITRETARLAGNYFVYSNKKIINQLNFKFQSIDDTLNWCCDYYIALTNAKK